MIRSIVTIILSAATTFCLSQTFTDIAASQNINHIQSSPNHWANGLSFYDFNEDGWDDLTLPASNDSIVFYVNNNGTFNQIGSMLYAPGAVRQIIWVDYFNNGVLDLCVTYDNLGIRMYENDGNFNFTDVTASLGISTALFKGYGVSFADPDQDNDLDFYVCSYDVPGITPTESPNLYYENQNNQFYIEKATSLGIDNSVQPSFMPVWFDYDNDGDLDLHVINDREYAGNALYENLGNGNWTEVSAAVGIENYGHNPMSNSISDFDNDGDYDIFESDVANGAYSFGLPVDYKLYQYDNGSYTDVAPIMGVDTNIFAWGGVWVDFDNDSYEDLYIATSLIDTVGWSDRSSVFYRNNMGTSFSNYTDSVYGDIVCSSYCPVKGDINNDGFYDIAVLNDAVASNLLLNSGNNNNYIKITPYGIISNTHAIGSEIEVFANGEHQTQTVFCGSGICAQNSQHKIFGIGAASVIDSVVVTFPSGQIRKLYNLPANQSIDIYEIHYESVQISNGANSIEACPGDTISIGTTGMVNYDWNNGSISPTLDITSSGLYYYTAESIAGDTVFRSDTVYIDFEPTLVITESQVNNPCGITGVGSIELQVAQSVLVSSIDWSNGETGWMIDSLNAGLYSYTLYTAFGCIYSNTIEITDAPQFTPQVFTTPVSDTALGTAQIYIWGGVEPFTYLMDTVTVSSTITDLDAGSYSVTIIDSNGCSAVLDFTIFDQSTTGITENVKEIITIYYAESSIWICGEEVNDLHSIVIIDIAGRNIEFSSVESVNSDCLKIPVSLPPGIYQVRTRGNIQTSKSIVIR